MVIFGKNSDVWGMKALISFLVVIAGFTSCSQGPHGFYPMIGSLVASGTPVLQGITFSTEPGRIYLPMAEVEATLGRIEISESQRRSLRRQVDGTALISLSDLQMQGVERSEIDDKGQVRLKKGGRKLGVAVGRKWVVIDLSKQDLKAWQGGRLVLESRVSSGRGGRTPRGSFEAGPYKARRHYSSLYNNAPMPWSVQVTGNIFTHGFGTVPKYPASHGCIRMPLDEGNPAKFFYEWVDRGTPILVE